MKVYNTLTRNIEPFKPLRFPDVKMYQCGPTPYNFAHIGNFRTYILEDAIAKTLHFLGYKVTQTMNVTDIDDKTIRDSQKENVSLRDFTRKYTEVFMEDFQKLWATLPQNFKPISEIIPEMIRMIQTLLNKGFAYLAEDGSVYYSISKFKNYGKLAHLDFSGMKQSVRIDNDEYEKEVAADFVLWKAWKPSDGENAWEAEFEIPDLPPTISQGEREQKQKVVIKWRPGWHIECSACAMNFFWPQIDIHMGGEDNIFPHHQNEIAQTEACTGKQFSKYWFHVAHLLVDGKKMSKSAGNFYTLRDIEKKYEDSALVGEENERLYRAVRLAFLNGKYREQINFSFDKIEQNINTLKNLDEVCKRLSRYESEYTGVRNEFREYMQDIMARYIEALEEDFSFPEALAIIFEFSKYVQTELSTWILSDQEQNSCIDMFVSLNQVFGILDEEIFSAEQEDIPEDIIALATERQEAKDEKNYAKADEIRDQLSALWYVVKDTKEGSIVERM